eukprot:TRINITY_DN1117_c0_g1_i2.p1 TRINITY_DN1117_c0_g1~~TRINITY_DN1117_c0_g1_i2.p1  ORF type:complete len:210 (+),score=32.36 TRINITY_DN1117_c0_g1_i2:26-655(+)
MAEYKDNSNASWRTIQAITGSALSAYATMHLFNHWLAIHSQDAYDNVMLALRELYQHPSIECAGLGVLALHIYAGRQIDPVTKSKTASSKLQRYTGTALGGLLGLHVIHTRILPALDDAPADFAFVHEAMQDYPLIGKAFFGGLIMAGTCHTYNGLAVSLQRLGVVNSSQITRRLVALSACVLSAGAMAGLTGHLYPVARPLFRIPRSF